MHRPLSRSAIKGTTARVTARISREELGAGIVALVGAVVLGLGFVYARQPATLTELLGIPPERLLIAALAAAVALVCAAQHVIHHHFRTRDFVQHNEVGGYILAVVGALYAVVLGFLTVVAWQHVADAQQLVAQESAAAGDAWHTAVGLPNTERTMVRQALLQYANLMIQVEWPAMRSGRFDTQGDMLVMGAIDAAAGFVPANDLQSNAQAATMQQLDALHDARQRRISENTSGLSWFEWFVLIIGAAAVVSFCWLFGTANARVHLLMTATVAIVITSMLILLFEYQYPFRSRLGVTTHDWHTLIAHIRVMEKGTQMDMRM